VAEAFGLGPEPPGRGGGAASQPLNNPGVMGGLEPRGLVQEEDRGLRDDEG